jgi:hypothetical protein
LPTKEPNALNHERCEKTTFAKQNVHSMREAFYVAQKVGEKLG